MRDFSTLLSDIVRVRESPDNEQTLQKRIDRLRRAINRSYNLIRTTYGIYLIYCIYFWIAVMSTSDLTILNKSYIDVSPLKILIPFVVFYSIAPWVLVFIHIHLLLQLFLVSQKLNYYDKMVSRFSDDAIKDEQQFLIIPFLFCYMQSDAHIGKASRRMILVGNWLSLMALPIILLLWAQIRFITYHDVYFTWIIRVAVIIDMLIGFMLWFKIRLDCRTTWEVIKALWKIQFYKQLLFIFQFTLMIFCIASSLAVITIPEESIELWITAKGFDYRNNKIMKIIDDLILPRYLVASRQYLFSKEINPQLAGISSVTDQQQANNESTYINGLNLIDRDLKKADLRGIKLIGAKLKGAKLNGAKLDGINLSASDLEESDLTGASLGYSTLVAVNFANAKLIATDLQHANLTCSNLKSADFTAANLINSKIYYCNLANTIFDLANLQNITLSSTNTSTCSFKECFIKSFNINKKDSTKEALGLITNNLPKQLVAPLVKKVNDLALTEQYVPPPKDNTKGSYCDNPKFINANPSTSLNLFYEQRANALSNLACENKWTTVRIVERIRTDLDLKPYLLGEIKNNSCIQINLPQELLEEVNSELASTH